MTTAPETSVLLARRIEGYLNGPAHELQAVARQHQALPVYTDVGGTLFLNAEGEVLFLDSGNATAGLKPERSREWQLAAKLAAVERFPELADLIPKRPEGVASCAECDGQGKVLNGLLRCGACCGLGWVQPAPHDS